MAKKAKKMTDEEKLASGWIYIYPLFIRRWGRIIYPKNGKRFKFLIDPNKKRN